MNTKPPTETVSETKAMRLLGGTSPRIRQELRQLQHRIFDRGVNQAYSRRYQLKDVLALRKERADELNKEISALRQQTNHKAPCHYSQTTKIQAATHHRQMTRPTMSIRSMTEPIPTD